ncbi:hypothetical protein [Paenibacillus kobensis]|uniref:hypothetical protein n=1 Tax=Paenibacillus kobensis TaxID=59841 RepID=UPI000FD7A9B4|nr:hypothetical protein [Paenibacillus kobensis]
MTYFYQPASHLQMNMDDDSPVNTPDIHGFVMLGRNTLFLEHLPMFNMENHEYQCILEASIPPEAMQACNQQRDQSPTIPLVLANLSSDLFTLPDVASGRRTSFEAEIVIWETDNPDTNPRLIPQVTVTVRRIVHDRHFNALFQRPSMLTYLLFGREDEVFLSHYLNQAPEFMHLLQAAAVPEWLSAEQIEAGVLIHFPDVAQPAEPNRDLLAAETYSVLYEGKEKRFSVSIGEVLWWSPID